MPAIIPIKLDEGITEQQAMNLLGQGFTVYPKVTVAIAPKIALVGTPPAGVTVVDLWVGPPEPLMPQFFVAAYIVELSKEPDAERIQLQKMAQRFFNVDLDALEKIVHDASTADHPDEPDGRTADQVGKDSKVTPIRVVGPPRRT